MDVGLVLEISLPALLLAILAFSWWRLRRAAFLALLLGAALAALLGESALRLLGIGVPARAWWVESQISGQVSGPAYQPGSELVYTYPSNPRGYFEPDGCVRGHINALGFRGSQRWPEKPSGVTRIAVIGDSFTLGIGVRDEHTWPAQLERVLGEERLEVLNFGVSATDTPAQVRYLASYVLGFDPDLVVLCFFLNDTERASTMEYLVRPHAFPALRLHSHLLHALLGAVERAALRPSMLRHYRDGFREDCPGWRSARDALRGAKALLDERDVGFVVAIHPVLMELDPDGYPFAGIHRTVADFCRAEVIAVLDLFEALQGRSERELWVHESDRHPNEIANGLTAQALAEFLRRQGLVR